MPDYPHSNRRSESTTWQWKRVRIRRPANGHTDSVPKGHRWRLLLPVDPRRPQHITVKLRGGPEAWVEVHARGDFCRYTGDTAIIDILGDITTGNGGKPIPF